MPNIQYYQEFAALSHYLSFSKTSEELCISQSALSKHISALEQELGLTLFIRNSKIVPFPMPDARFFPM